MLWQVKTLTPEQQALDKERGQKKAKRQKDRDQDLAKHFDPETKKGAS